LRIAGGYWKHTGFADLQKMLQDSYFHDQNNLKILTYHVKKIIIIFNRKANEKKERKLADPEQI